MQKEQEEIRNAIFSEVGPPTNISLCRIFPLLHTVQSYVKPDDADG